MTILSQILRIALLMPAIAGISIAEAQTNYYSKSTGNLDLLATWGTSTNGTGTAPTSFTANNQVFNIRNNASPTIGAAWTVTGSNSKVVVGDGTSACNFQVPSGSSLTGKVDVSANATLSIANTTNPTLGTLNSASTVAFNGAGNQTIPVATYGNLTYSGTATGSMAGACTINGNLSVSNGNLVLDNTNNTSYTFTVGGAFNVTTGGYVEFGSGSGSGTSTVNLSGNLSQTGSGYLQTSGNVPNGIINFTGTAQTAQLVNGQYINYNINSGSTVTLAGNFSYYGSYGYSADFTVNSGGTLDCGTNTLLTLAYGGAVNSFTLSSGASLITANTAGIGATTNTGSIQVQTMTFSSGANYTYNGTAAQVTGVFPTTPTASTVNNLTINNTAGVTLSQAEAVNGTLTLTSGLLTTTSTNLITINNAATVTGASNSSFVNGPVTKLGQQAFTFPIGVSGTGYVPIAISAPASTTDAFFAQYVRSSARALGSIGVPGLNHISGCDYWTLNHTAGSSSVNVTAYWNANSPCGGGIYVNNPATVALAHFNGTSWNAYGNSSVSGTTSSGSVTWNGVSTFSPFALGSTSLQNPLPVVLTGFNAKWQDDGSVALSWETQQESNSNHFAIQRSADGQSWQTIGAVDAAGSSTTPRSYAYWDKDPQPDVDYYRLQLVDNDGSGTYSEVRLVTRSSGRSIQVFPNPAADHIDISFGTGSRSAIVDIRLLDIQGRLLVEKKLADPAGQTITLPVSGFAPGTYIVQLTSGEGIRQTQVIVIKR